MFKAIIRFEQVAPDKPSNEAVCDEINILCFKIIESKFSS